MATVVSYPTGAIREALDRAASDPSLPASAKRRELRTIRDELKHLSGYADSLLGDLSLAEQRDALDDEREFRIMEDAAIREEMLKRGLATGEQLDELGLLANAEVAERRADGTLSEADSGADFAPFLHPRGRAGQFVDAPQRLVSRAPERSAPEAGPAEQDLPESMPPPRPHDPMVAEGLSPLAADGLRTYEPDLNRREIGAYESFAARSAVAAGMEGELEHLARARWERWRETADTDRSRWTPPDGVAYSADVAAIRSPADAERYLRGIGVEAHMTPPDTAQGRNLAADADFFRQIAQAVTDARDRYPTLRDGAHPLGAVRLWSDSSQREGADVDIAARQDAVWAATGIDLADASKNPSMLALPSAAIRRQEDGGRADIDPASWAGDPVDIILSDVNQDGLQVRGGDEWQESNATRTPYGRMMHELGHAVWASAGREDRDLDETSDDPDPFRTASEVVADHFTPEEAMRISPYAASGESEAWAEFFATVNVPGAADRLDPVLRLKLEAIAADANARVGAKVL